MKKQLFVTGTNTGVGKTTVSRALARAFWKMGFKVCALKPVESGGVEQNGRMVPQDALLLAKAAASGHGIEDVCRYCFKTPVSPHLAAKIEGRDIDGDEVLKMLSFHARSFEITIVEGAGGFLVPLTDSLLYGDLIARTDFELVVVARNVLGEINSTLLTLEAARKRGIKVIGVVLNGSPKEELGNANAIEKFGEIKIIGQMPDSPTDDDDFLAKIAKENLRLDWLIEQL